MSITTVEDVGYRRGKGTGGAGEGNDTMAVPRMGQLGDDDNHNGFGPEQAASAGTEMWQLLFIVAAMTGGAGASPI